MEDLLAILVAIVLGGFSFFILRVARYVRENPNLKLNVAPALYPYVEEAIRWAANKVEELDKSGELAKFIDPYKEKGKQKLDLAINYAVEYIELNVNELLARYGIDYKLDIPEDFIKDMIQRYVWENPNLFPSSKNTPMAQEAASLAAPSGKHARLRPSNYPANLYQKDETETPPVTLG